MSRCSVTSDNLKINKIKMENQQSKDLDETNKLIAQQILQSKEQMDEFYKNMGIQNPFGFNIFSSLSQPLLPLFRQQPINNTNNLFNPLPINIPKFEPLNFNPISNIGIGNLNKQTNWKVSNLNFGLEDNSINLSIRLENSTTINEIDKQKIKSALDSIKFIEKLIVDNGSVEKDENKNVEKQQNETKNNPSNDSNNQQNLRKIDKNLENQQRRQKIDKAYEQLRQMLIKSDEINQTQTNQIKELKTRLEQRKDQTILPKLVHAKNVAQNELRIKQLETKTKESSKNKSEQIEQIQSEHKREIEDLKKEFQEEMKKEISDLNSKFSVLFSETNKKNEEENKLNNEKINEQNEFRIKQLELKIKELTDLSSDQNVAMQIQELQTNHNKEIETYNNEFVILKKQIEEKFTVFNQQNSPKVEERNNTIMDVNTSKIGKLETKINELNDKISNLTIAYVKTITTQSSQISIKHEKEIETLKKEFQEKMEKEISDLNSKFSVLFSENKKNKEENKINEKINEQNEFRIKQLELKIKDLTDNSKTSEHAINYFKSMSILINDMQINHNKEIEDLKKEFRESISSKNSKFFDEENKINDEEIDEFMKNYVLHNPNPTEEEKLRIAARILCVSIDKIDIWLENHQKEQKIKENDCNSSLEIINDFDLIDDENEENNEEIEKNGEE